MGQALIEIADPHAKRAGDVVKHWDRDPAAAGLVLLELLMAYAKASGQTLQA
jgi:hypothetical protein